MENIHFPDLAFGLGALPEPVRVDRTGGVEDVLQLVKRKPRY